MLYTALTCIVWHNRNANSKDKDPARDTKKVPMTSSSACKVVTSFSLTPFLLEMWALSALQKQSTLVPESRQVFEIKKPLLLRSVQDRSAAELLLCCDEVDDWEATNWAKASGHPHLATSCVTRSPLYLRFLRPQCNCQMPSTRVTPPNDHYNLSRPCTINTNLRKSREANSKDNRGNCWWMRTVQAWMEEWGRVVSGRCEK